MPAALALSVADVDLVEQYLTAMRVLDRRTGRSTTMAARSFCAKLHRAGGWDSLPVRAQSDAIAKARSFASWLLVTGRLTIAAERMTCLDLRLGVIARGHRPDTYAWFTAAGERLRLPAGDAGLQWNALMTAAAVTGISPERCATVISTRHGTRSSPPTSTAGCRARAGTCRRSSPGCG